MRRLMEPCCEDFSGSYWEEDCEPRNGLSLYWSHTTYCCQLIPFSFLSPATFICGVTLPSPFSLFLFSTISSGHLRILWACHQLQQFDWVKAGKGEHQVPFLYARLTAFSAGFEKICRLGTNGHCIVVKSLILEGNSY